MADDIKSALSKPAAASRFTSSFISGYLSPAFGARSKSEIDLLVFSCLIDAKAIGPWEPPALGAVTAPTAVLIRPDGHVAWVGAQTQLGLAEALTTWFGPGETV